MQIHPLRRDDRQLGVFDYDQSNKEEEKQDHLSGPLTQSRECQNIYHCRAAPSTYKVPCQATYTQPEFAIAS
jgi:hypothetical protein